MNYSAADSWLLFLRSKIFTHRNQVLFDMSNGDNCSQQHADDIRMYPRAHFLKKVGTQTQTLCCRMCGAIEMAPWGCVLAQECDDFCAFDLTRRWKDPNSKQFCPSHMIRFKHKYGADDEALILFATIVHPQVCPMLVDRSVGTKENPIVL